MSNYCNKVKQFFVAIFSILYLNVLGQELTKGLIMPSADGSFKSCCIYIPTSGLIAYEQPNGKQIAKLELGNYKPYLKIGQESKQFDFTNFYMVGYEVMAMVYVDKKGEFVKTKNGYWLSITELKSKGLITVTWMDYLISKKSVLGWYANDPGLNLRTEPSKSSEILATLKGDLWQITPTDEVNGLWCKVIVKQYKAHPCSGEDEIILQTLTGWVKLLSDEQKPNVWNYGKGC